MRGSRRGSVCVVSEHLSLAPGRFEWREIEGDVVVLDKERVRYVAVNRAGSALWAMLAAGATHDDLVSGLAAAWGLDAEAARRDVDAFIAQLDLIDAIVRDPRGRA